MTFPGLMHSFMVRRTPRLASRSRLSWALRLAREKGDRFIFCPTLRLARSGFGWLRRNQGSSGHAPASLRQ